MANRAALRGSVGITLGILLFAGLLAVNYLSARHLFTRLDLTENKEFTVAPATRKVLEGLNDVVNVKLYFSKTMPEQVAMIPARVHDLLSELQAYAHGKLRVESLDPAEDADTEARVRSLGIPRQPLMVIEKNKTQTVEVYLGIGVFYADKKEIIPAVLDDATLEYDLVSAVLKVTEPRKTIGLLAGNGEHDLYGDYRQIGELLRKQYEVVTVDLSGGKHVPATVTTLIVAGPRAVPERQRYEIDQFLMRGGHAFFLVDTYEVDPMQLVPSPIDSGLDDLLASYGVRVQRGLVADWAANETVQIQAGSPLGGMPMMFVVPYPLWPKAIGDYMSATNPIVSRLPSVVLPWTSALEVVKDADDPFEVVELIKTSPYGSNLEQIFSANPRSLPEPREEDLTQQLLAVAISGPQKSFFAGKDIPAPEPEREDQPDPAPTPPAEPAPERRDHTDATQIVVLGGSSFAVDNMTGQRAFAANPILFLNAVDWLTVGSDLIGIRSRQASLPLLDPERRETGERVAPLVNIFGVPLLVAVFGIVWHQIRRRRHVVLSQG